MKRVILMISICLTAISCGPSAYMFNIETRKPAKKNVELAGRNIGILVNGNAVSEDSVSYISYAGGMAETMEKELDLEKQSLPVFTGSTDSENFKNGFSDLDMIFAIDRIKINDISIGNHEEDYYSGMKASTIYVEMEAAYKLYDLYTGEILDMKNGKDTLVWYVYSDWETPDRLILAKTAASKEEICTGFGKVKAEEYFDEWISDQRALYVYSGNSGWTRAYEDAANFNWNKAVDFWIGESASKTPQKAAAAAYNLSVASEINGNYALALKWLDHADNKYKMNSSTLQRQIILSKMKELRQLGK